MYNVYTTLSNLYNTYLTHCNFLTTKALDKEEEKKEYQSLDHQKKNNMNSIMSTLCVIVVATLCLHEIEAQQSDLISQTCAATRFKDVCMKTFSADPSSKSADIHGLARIALNAAAKKSKSIQSKVAKLQAKATDRYVVQALKDCAENYDSANEQLADSLTAIEKKRYNDVNTWVSATMSNGESCEDGFKAGTSNLTEDNALFSQLCSNVLAISNKASGR